MENKKEFRLICLDDNNMEQVAGWLKENTGLTGNRCCYVDVSYSVKYIQISDSRFCSHYRTRTDGNVYQFLTEEIKAELKQLYPKPLTKRERVEKVLYKLVGCAGICVNNGPMCAKCDFGDSFYVCNDNIDRLIAAVEGGENEH